MDGKKLAAGDWFFGKILHMGANWQTTLSGISGVFFEGLTLLSGASYALGDVGTVIPPALKAKIFVASLAAQGILKIWNSIAQKSKNVTGGTTQQTVSGNVADTGTQTLVDETVKATINSGEPVTAEQRQAVAKNYTPSSVI